MAYLNRETVSKIYIHVYKNVVYFISPDVVSYDCEQVFFPMVAINGQKAAAITKAEFI